MNRFMQLGVNKDGRDFVTGDIHGKYTQLMEAMDVVNFDTNKDRLFSVGDLIDRGWGNMECLDLIWEPWFFAVTGNHEFMMAEAVDDDASNSTIQHWIMNGGHWYHSLDFEDVQKLKNVYAPHILETMPIALEFLAENGKRVGVAHADLPPQWPWWEIRKHLECLPEGYDMITQHLIWSRTKIQKVNFTQELYGVDLVIHGHTPCKTIQWRGNTVFIDTASYDRYTPVTLTNVMELFDGRKNEETTKRLEDEEDGSESVL